MFSLYHPRHDSLRGVEACPKTWMVHALLYEKSVPHERIELNIAAGHHESEAFIRFHPARRLPLLIETPAQHEGLEQRLCQPMAMLHYLEYRFTRPVLLGNGTARAPTLEALAEAGELMAQVERLTGAHLEYAGAVDQNGLERNSGDVRGHFESRQRFDRCLDLWELRLGDQEFCCGDALSLADFVLVTHLRVAERLGHSLREHPQLARLCDSLCERESLVATAPLALSSHVR